MVKLDFIDSESRESIDFELAALRLAAERKLMINFPGVLTPTGEPRTYPNEITREGFRGLELNKIVTETVIPARHNAALPFTRLAVGHGDRTPLGYSRPGLTTWAHQLVTVGQFVSQLQVIGEHPETLLRDPHTRPALDVLKAIPAVWDKTRVLEPSRIGELSLIARRTGQTWFLSALSGDHPVSLPALDLSFLGDREYRLWSLGHAPARSRLGFCRHLEPGLWQRFGRWPALAVRDAHQHSRCFQPAGCRDPGQRHRDPPWEPGGTRL